MGGLGGGWLRGGGGRKGDGETNHKTRGLKSIEISLHVAQHAIPKVPARPLLRFLRGLLLGCIHNVAIARLLLASG